MKQFSPRSLAICAVSVALFAFYLSIWLSFADSPAASRSDFMIYYAAGTLPLSKLYNIDSQREVEANAGSPFAANGAVLPFNHTPIFVPLLHLLVNGNYAASYLRWTAFLWVAALMCALLVFRMTADVALAFAAGSFYPLFIYIQQGHDTVFMLLGILLGAHLLSRGQDLLAGIALSLSTLKPHYAIFLAVPLLAKPKAFLGFFVASTLLAVYSIILIGTPGVFNFISLLKMSAGGEGFGMRPLFMVNLLGLMERAGLSPQLARPIAWAAFSAAAISLLVLWKRNPLRPPIALTMVLAVFTSPHLYAHDLALLLVSFASLTKPYPLFLLVSSVALVALTIIPGYGQFAVAYLLLGVLFFMSVKDVRLPNKQVLTVASNT